MKRFFAFIKILLHIEDPRFDNLFFWRFLARVAELADALVSDASEGNLLGVQVPSLAQI